MIKKISSLLAISLLTFLFIFCTTDEEMLISPFGNADNYLKVTKYTADKTLLYSFEDSTKIRIKVVGVDNSPIEGLVINFTTQIGEITESSTTDTSGLAVATFVTNEDVGTNIITADSGTRTDTLSVHVFHYQPKYIELSSETSALLADGISKTSIIAVVKDSIGNPMEGKSVTFTTTLGGFETPIKPTDENGIATVELTSGVVTGTATIVASSPPASESINIEFFEYSPSFINLTLSEESILADGNATVEIEAQVLNEVDEPMAGVDVLFSTTLGNLIGNKTVKTNHDGWAIITLQSSGIMGENAEAIIVAEVLGSELRATDAVTLRGISIDAIVDSTNFSSGGYHNTFITVNVRESLSSTPISNTTINFEPTIGFFENNILITDGSGSASSILSVMVKTSPQSNQSVNVTLGTAPEINTMISDIIIPGVELLVSSIDGAAMGDGIGSVLLEAVLRENDSNRAIPSTALLWSTTTGTIEGQSITNSNGSTIVTLKIEYAFVESGNVMVTASYGDFVQATDTIVFLAPPSDNRLILGFEPNAHERGFIQCGVDTLIAERFVGITAFYVDGDGNPILNQTIQFRVVPNNFALICGTVLDNNQTLGTLAYPPQNSGKIVRIWGDVSDGSKGSLDIILPSN